MWELGETFDARGRRKGDAGDGVKGTQGTA